MFALTRFELRKLLAQRRTLTALAAIALMNLLFAAAFTVRSRHAGSHPAPHAAGRLIREFLDAPTYTQAILAPCMFAIFPIVLAVFGAHILAGEMERGQLRLVLCRPVSRPAVLGAKFIALSLLAFGMLAGLLVCSYAVGAALFPASGDVLIPGPMIGLRSAGILIIPWKSAWFRLGLSYLLAWPMTMSLAAMALMFSMLTRHFTSAAVLTAAVYFSSYIVGSISLLSAIHRFLPTRYLPFWRYALLPQIPWHRIGTDAAWTGLYTLAFLAVAGALFSLRDV